MVGQCGHQASLQNRGDEIVGAIDLSSLAAVTEPKTSSASSTAITVIRPGRIQFHKAEHRRRDSIIKFPADKVNWKKGAKWEKCMPLYL
jgi:hypothetical protein